MLRHGVDVAQKYEVMAVLDGAQLLPLESHSSRLFSVHVYCAWKLYLSGFQLEIDIVQNIIKDYIHLANSGKTIILFPGSRHNMRRHASVFH